MLNSVQLHASSVAIGGKGVLLLGESGSGKSDLALRLIDSGAVLVADDRVDITLKDDVLVASPPQTLQGMIEARGIGILTMPHVSDACLLLAVKLVARGDVERLPESAFFDCLGAKLPLHSLHAFDESTAAKIRFLCR